MKKHEVSDFSEGPPTERRRSSASVDEIHDLYSALQELVPSTASSFNTKNLKVNTSSSSLNSSETSQSYKQRSIQKELSKNFPDPLPSKTKQINNWARYRSHSLDDSLPTHSKRPVTLQDSFDIYKCKRILKNSKGRERSFDIVQQFDKSSAENRRERSNSLSAVLETDNGSYRARATSPSALLETKAETYRVRSNSLSAVLETDAGTYRERSNSVSALLEAEGKDTRVRSNFLSVLLETEGEYNKGRSNCSSVLLGNTSSETAANTPSFELEASEINCVSSTDNSRPKCLDSELCESLFENARKSGEDAITIVLPDHENGIKITFPTKKRFSAGDISDKCPRFYDPQTTSRRRSGGSLVLSAIISSASASPERKHKGILNSLGSKSQETERKDDISGDVSALVEVIQKFQQDSSTSKPSVSTDMQNFVVAIRDLMLTDEITPISTPSSSRASSRRTSITDSYSGGQKESLDELEAYFKAKLEDISKRPTTEKRLSDNKPHKSGKETIKCSNSREKESNNSRSSADKQSYLKPSVLIQEGNSHVDLLKTIDARLQPNAEFKASRRESRERSQSVHYTGLPAPIEIKINKSNNSPSHSIEEFTSTSRRKSNDREVDRTLWKEDQLMFAAQVNKRLQDWLEKATLISLQEKQEAELIKERDQKGRISFLVDGNECTLENQLENKGKKSRFAMRKMLRKKIKRSKSINNLTQPEQEKQSKSPILRRIENIKLIRSKSLHNLSDDREPQPKQKTEIFRSPQTLLRMGCQRLMRSKAGKKDKEKPFVDSKESNCTESDESFDDIDWLVSVTKSSCSSLNTFSSKTDNISEATETISSRNIPLQPQCERARLPRAGVRKTEKFHLKRIPRLPPDLPLFYNPRNDAGGDLEKSKNDAGNVTNLQTIENSLRFGYCEMLHESAKTSLLKNSLCPFIPTALQGTDEGFARSPSWEGSNDSPAHSPDLNDFRERAISTTSEDSGCPI